MANYDGTAGNDTYSGTNSADSIRGFDGNDSLTALDGNDTILGGNGNDTVFGGAGNDSILGGEGNDLMNGGAGADTINGEGGVNLLSYSGSAFAVNVNLQTGTVSGGDAAGDVISNIQSAQGSAWNDTLTGGTGTTKLNGLQGNDLITHNGTSGLMGLYGGDGNDSLSAGYAGGSKTAGGQFHLFGGSGDDVLTMNLTFSSSAQGYQGHHAYGGQGSDTFNLTNSTSTAKPLVGRIDDFDIAQDTIQVDGVSLNFSNLPSNVKVVEYNGQQWLLVGSNALYALEGARYGGTEVHFTDITGDNLATLPGAQFIDQVNWVPDDLYNIADLTNVNVDIASTVSGSLVFRDIVGGTGRDFFYDDVVSDDEHGGGSGSGAPPQTANASISGGSGDDVINAGKGDDTVNGENGADLIAGGQDEDLLNGGSNGDQIWGGSENDSLYGGSGNDTLRGGTSDDGIYGGNDNDSVDGNAGADTVVGGSGSDTVSGGHGSDRLEGGDGNDTLLGQNNADTLIGGAGTDRFTGGGGGDRFRFMNGDLIDWDLIAGTPEEKHPQFDWILDFEIGSDKIDLSNLTGASDVVDLTDLRIYETTISGNDYFTIEIDATNERVLIDVPDTTVWGEVYEASNFIF